MDFFGSGFVVPRISSTRNGFRRFLGGSWSCSSPTVVCVPPTSSIVKSCESGFSRTTPLIFD